LGDLPAVVDVHAVNLVGYHLVVAAEAAVDVIPAAAEGVDGVVVVAAGELVDADAAVQVVGAVDVVVTLAAGDGVPAGLAVELVDAALARPRCRCRRGRTPRPPGRCP
jgi:hypothetical protein